MERVRRTSRRSFLRAAGVMGGAAVVAACGATPAPEGAGVEAGSASTQAPAPAASERTMRYMTWWSPAGSPSFRTWWDFIKEDFEETHPGTTFEMLIVPFGDYVTKFLSSAASGDLPHAMHCSIIWAYDFATRDTLAELSDLISVTPELAEDQFFPTAVFYTKNSGRTIGVPHEGPDGRGLGLNLDLFEEAGVDSSKEAVWQWTWDDMVDAAVRLTKTEGGMVEQAGWLQHAPDLALFVLWLYTQNTQFYNEEFSGLALREGTGEAVLQFQYDMLNTHKVSPPVSPDRNDNQLFYGGKAAMYTFPLFLINDTMINAPDLRYDLAPLPAGPDGLNDYTVFFNMDTVPVGSPDKDLAWEWVSYFCGSRIQEKKAELISMPSPRLDVYESQAWQGVLSKVPMSNRVPELAAKHTVGPYPYVRYAELQEAMRPFFEEAIITGTMTVSQAMDAATEAGNTILSSSLT